MIIKQFFRKATFIIGLIFWFFIIVATFLVGWTMSFTSIDINTASMSSGTVVAANIQQNTGTRAPASQTALVIFINSERTGFWLYRASQNYDDLTTQLPKGTEITIYRGEQFGANNYYTIYQIQKGKRIIYSKGEYEQKEKLAGRFIVLPGAVILLIMLIYQADKRLFRRKSAPLDPV